MITATANISKVASALGSLAASGAVDLPFLVSGAITIVRAPNDIAF